MDIIAIINQKGGVGKTTTTVNLSAELASRGHKVLAIDLDPQSNLTGTLTKGRDDFALSIGDVFADPKRNLVSKSIIPIDTIPNLDFIPATLDLSRVIENSRSVIHRERILSRQLEKLSGYDFIILDCPPNLSLTSLNAMMAADTFLIPVDGGSYSLSGLRDLLDALEEVKETDDVNYLVFRNEYAKANKKINDFLSTQLETLGNRFLKSTVRRAEAIGQASASDEPLRQFQSSSVALNDYKSLTDELLTRLNV